MKKVIRLYFKNKKEKIYIGSYCPIELETVIKDLSVFIFYDSWEDIGLKDNYNQIIFKSDIAKGL